MKVCFTRRLRPVRHGIVRQDALLQVQLTRTWPLPTGTHSISLITGFSVFIKVFIGRA